MEIYLIDLNVCASGYIGDQYRNLWNINSSINSLKLHDDYTRRTLVGNKIVDHSDVVGASPVGAAPTTSYAVKSLI